jgi:hypothetical protein
MGPADFDGDETIDSNDFRLLADNWLKGDAYLPTHEPDANGLVVQYCFDGSIASDVPSPLTDDTATFTASIIAGTDPDSQIIHTGPNPMSNTSGTSASFLNDNWDNNTGDTFLIPDSGGLDFSTFDEFTVTLFVNPSSTGTGHTRRIFSEYVYACMYLDADNTLHAVRKWGPGDWDENWTHLTASLTMDQWSHLAMTWDPNAADDKFNLYVNGDLAATAPGTSTTTLDSTAGFAIGGYQRENGSTAQFFLGSIDEFALYDYALSLQEIAYLANPGQGHVYIPLDSPANLMEDDVINLKDYAAFAIQWLSSCQ